MKYIWIMFLSMFMFACSQEKKADFINFSNSYECNIPMVRTTINNVEIDFIIDTGASTSLIDSEWYLSNQDKVTFVTDVDVQYHGIGGSTEQDTKDVVRMNLPVGYVTLVESDLSSVKNKLNSEGYNVVGVIGSDFFKIHKYIIDFEKRMLYPANVKDSLNEKHTYRRPQLPSACQFYLARKELGLTANR